jgi:hypothetical protein
LKVFISWSGPQSKRLGEAIRDWLPGVLQLVTPYFTPSDIEKGVRWSTDISEELSNSQIGILCITQDNIHSDWILFEAGALSKSLEKSHVCPILFGITNTDLAGPLKQFQTTEFEKNDIHKLLGVINGLIGEHKLPQKTLDTVFEKWWPDLDQKIGDILSEAEVSNEPIRSDRELLEEILQLARVSSKRPQTIGLPSGAVKLLLFHYIALHDEQIEKSGGYQNTLDSLQKMHKSVEYISKNYKGINEELDDLIDRFRKLSYVIPDNDEELDYDIPF